MKTITITQLAAVAVLAAGLLAATAAMAADDSTTNAASAMAPGSENGDAPAPADATAAPADQTPQPPADADATTTAPAEPAPAAPATQPAPATASVPVDSTPVAAPAMTPAPNPSGQGLRLNFRGVPLEEVLTYLSDAAGFIIHPEADIKDIHVTVWSEQPLTKKEAVDLLNTILEKNGLGVIQDGRILTIRSVTDMTRTADIPVEVAVNADDMQKGPQVVTVIIPVHSLNAVQLVKDLDPLLPPNTTLTANDAGNSLVMTDTRANIRRVTEIIKALDSVTSSINTLRVFPLKYADATALVTVIKDIFPAPDTTGNNRGGGGNGFGRFQRMFGGGGGGPGGGGGGADTGHTPTERVSATADGHSNSLIVSAPEDLMPTIAELVTNVDLSVEDLTEVRVFPLKHADPTEMATLLGNLFPDQTSTTSASQQAPQFGRFGFGGFGPGGGGGGRPQTSGAPDTSDRMKLLGHVTAVADNRTASVVVSASKDLMPQISEMIAQLDESSAGNQHVRVYHLQGADPYDVQQVLQGIFPAPTGLSSASSASSAQNNVLQTRATTLNQQQLSTSSSGTFGGGGGTGSRIGGN
jgi:type II secretory pathway component GspD/PulD (secretin)